MLSRNERSSGDLFTYELTLPALAIEQAPGRTLYSFAVDGKRLPHFAAVSRVNRTEDDNELAGYQRGESRSHIQTIRRYLETSESAILPNALVVAFDPRVRFEPLGPAGDGPGGAQIGQLVIPVDEAQAEHEKPGWIVDGQQRSAAIRDADVASFPVYVTAFITDSVEEQRSQFILVNSTKPLPKGLIHELLPSVPVADLPPALLRARYPARLLERLNYDEGSPFRREIRTSTHAAGKIKDNSILKMLAASIEDGVLYTWFDPATGTGEDDRMVELLTNYWSAVATVFAKAWSGSPRESRLVHGVGILAMGALMDQIGYELMKQAAGTDADGEPPSQAAFEAKLALVAGDCCWTDGVWALAEDDQRRWNELQNTPRDIKALTDHLLRVYRQRSRAAEAAGDAEPAASARAAA